MKALEAWGRERWTAGHVEQLERLAASDPYEKAKERALELLGQRAAGDR